MRKIIILIASLALMLLLAIMLPFGPAQADGNGAPCDVQTTTVVDSPEHVVHHDAVTHDEVVHHDAVTHIVHHAAVPAGPDLWWNWSPNHEQGPFEGPPDFPVDARGTWQGPHENGGPSQDTYGTFQQGNGHGSWFHREHGTPAVDAYDETVVDQPAYDETVTIVDSEAYDETVPAVTHEEDNPNYPCENPPPTDVKHPTKHEPGTTLTPKQPKDAPVVPTEVEAGL